MRIRKKICFIFALLCIFNLSACTNAETKPQMSEAVLKTGEFSVWVAYWDIDNGIKELSKSVDALSSVSSFALYFNNDGTVFVPEDLSNKHSEISADTNKNNINSYICVVNDVIDENGNIVQKDTNIIRKLLSSPTERSRHINELISFAQNNEYFGIEIDYEKLDENVWPDFVLFCSELYNQCVLKKLDLRVIFEPRAPLDRYTFPDGPEYIMMAYNLYGASTEPGPKADVDFIKELSVKMNNVPGKKWIAFASGGFDWQTGGETLSISEKEALDIINIYKCLPARDEKSGGLYFYYTDDKGKDHTVWYADNSTFDVWTRTARECGFENICLWKLGGNSSETIEYFKSIFAE